MQDLTKIQLLLIKNWEKRNKQLKTVVLDSMVGLDDLETLEALAKVRKGVAYG